ncbi:TBC1 domain family member 5 [Arthroderma uncinatum]|uniref:TBC1 domain family member 5 n=1 Tax=Arthroderma uncinatum TaxID=74035 RepID=UPI00144AC702|nr:TBC1 domain family member 5 [Arthroderma uncinatum]KAF3491622.1 TBC1 domain family member 5 [Arthroderma uncinatum]
MQTAKQFYEHNDGKNSMGNSEVSSIITRSQHIHLVLLRQIDPELADHLVAIEILPQIFLTSSLIDMICVSMLLRIRWQLMEADYSTALSLLLKYPSPEPIKPRTFVLDALYIEHNTTFEGASYLFAKYSGKPIPQRARNSISPPRIGSTTRQKSSSISRDIFNTPSSSPNRLNSKRLDSIFQDVSEGLYRRAEGWGVTKAVRGAVVEARRNMQNLQAGASSSTVFNHDGPAWDSPSPPRISLATVRELNLKISTLEQRNKALAMMLGDALDTLQTHPSTAKEKDQDGSENLQSMDEVVARIQKVKTCLQDPAIPLDAEGRPEAKQPCSIARSSDDSPTRVKVTKELPSSPTVGSQKATARPSTEQLQENTKITKATKEPQSPRSPPSSISTLSPTTNTIKGRPIRPTRTSVRDSSFSWILGDDQDRPSFATSASEPPEQRREPSKSLFTGPEGDDRAAGQPDIEGLVLADLQHAPQSMQQQQQQQHPDK